MLANKNSNKLGINNQKLMLFNLGNAISGPPTSKGNRKLPKPPIIAGITMKKIISIAWAVIILLYNWLSAMYCTPGPDNSSRINTEKAVPTKPENRANIRYNVPISFAFDDKNHLSFHIVKSNVSATAPLLGTTVLYFFTDAYSKFEISHTEGIPQTIKSYWEKKPNH
jgi:hypothetical protein